jgi:hypothetical protein
MLTIPDIKWLKKLLDIVTFIYKEYPELFSTEDEETMKIAGELIGRLDK